MGLKDEVSVGDYVIYKDSSNFVLDEDGRPLKVVEIKVWLRKKCVFYENGEFDYYNSVVRCPSLLLELL